MENACLLYTSNKKTGNSGLKHCTVFEEAHLLLIRTSMDQSQEGANLQGKSVEMLTNAIAEMRTYGEAFIIADQAPALLDEAVIRNTNTKIVLRLPCLLYTSRREHCPPRMRSWNLRMLK